MNAPRAGSFPLHTDDDVVVWQRGRALTAGELRSRIAAVARNLPATSFIINLCEGRADFMAAFFAAGARRQVNLLPASRAPVALSEIQAAYPDHYLVTDESIVDLLAAPGAPAGTRELSADAPIAIAFTSGSTGRPEGHVKSWRTLAATAQLARARFLPDGRAPQVVGTVPSQHMYGLETTLSLIVVSGGAVSDARPFYPADIAAELAALQEPRVLVTTPVHLRACLTADLDLPALELIISATAPLSAEIAAAAEARWHTRVEEIYGSTEAGSMATRRTVKSALWQPHTGARLDAGAEGTTYHGAHLPEPVPLHDEIEMARDNQFRLLGRGADLIKVAGKRASLAELTQRLLAVRGVIDAVVFVPRADERPAALVVAPRLTPEAILAELARAVDPVFLPRPLLLVSALPRNETGKLPRAALLAAIGLRDD